MCVIVVQPRGVQIKKRSLQNCFLSNPDGAGFMWVENGKILLEKGFFTFDSFHYAYMEALERNRKSPFILHFRIATSGKVDHENCHPFRINESTAFVHNGIFWDFSFTGENKSDTRLFNNSILKELPDNWDSWEGIKALIEYYAASTDSKLVFLNKNKRYWICEEDKGTWNKGAWYSNRAYELELASHKIWWDEGKKWDDGAEKYAFEEASYLEQQKKTLMLDTMVTCSQCLTDMSVTEAVWEQDVGYLCGFCVQLATPSVKINET